MKTYFLILGIGLLTLYQVEAQGHGPIYGLQTPTLAKGGINMSAAGMSIATEDDASYMLRYTFFYGITEDLQVTLTTPTVIERLENAPRTRGNSMMPSNGDIEAALWYRFFSNAFGVGKRFESTAILGVSAPTEDVRGQVNVGNSIHGAISTGYASRTWYAWLGGGYQYYFEKDNQQLGDLPYASMVIGYRPDVFMGDYPKPDWRVFIESLVEFPGDNKYTGQQNFTDERSKKVLVGPSFLGLYGAWGISFGALFPVVQDLTPKAIKENYRVSINLSYWL
ncbi:hypothetical protein INR75_12895 [Zunongwangia sp. SCSIO 43204]|jgi:hypothetical protein|uniref:hypothetical protein n=2 Tax=Flavobacteriales TaxID=200644 RepID=UPI00056C1CE7|nr:hypothetical protein [Salegentibacter sp. 24]MBO2545328.1 hypothetical protein [Salegentibacter sp. BDJ18]TDN80348.1 hypothetical protein DET49_13325 [Salegentibacter sp. 24]UAB83103.1 hypothetical protein INR75_12895 [Zunongwangia sp. SCSIO 43204]